MIRPFCDRCGIEGRAKRPTYVLPGEIVVRVVTLQIDPGGRTMDLCGECRKALHPVLDDFLAELRVPEEAPR